MKRITFLKASGILGATALLPIDNVFSQGLKESGMDKLTDKDGNFVLQPLPYGETWTRWGEAVKQNLIEAGIRHGVFDPRSP